MKICVNIDLTEEIGKLFLGTKSLHLEMHLENFSLIFSNVIWWIESQKRTPLHNNNNFFFQCTGFVTSFAEQETPLQRVARSDQIDVRPSAGPIHGLLDLAISQTIDPFLDVHALHQKRTQFGQVLR